MTTTSALRVSRESSSKLALRATKLVHVDCELSEKRFYIKICDEGEGYDPCDVPDCCADENLEVPGGRGLALIRAYMTSVELTDCGRCVIMEKVLD